MVCAVMAYLGLVAVAVGVFLVSVPAGLVVAGAGLIVAAYVTRCLEAQREISRAPRR